MRGHDPGPGWPDRPDRLRALEDILATPRFASLTRIDAPTATRAAILRVHAPELLTRLEQATPAQGTAQLGNDVVMNAGTLSAALHAAGGGVAAIEAVMRRQARNAFVHIGGHLQPAASPRFSRSRLPSPTPPEAPGASADAALAQWGYSTTDIQRLRQSGAVKNRA